MTQKFGFGSDTNGSKFRFSLTQKSTIWQIKFKQNGLTFKKVFKKPFKGFSNTLLQAEPPFAESNESNFDQWKKVLSRFKSKDKVFEKQHDKIRDGNISSRINSGDVVNYIKHSSNNSVSWHLNEMPKTYICLDIDLDFVGNRILDLFYNKFIEDLSFEQVFQKCILVQTETPGHLHLYYKTPNNLPESFVNSHSVFTVLSRLGFPIEYRLKYVTFASLKRKIIYAPDDLSEVSFLPKILFPYNGPQPNPKSFENNLTGSLKKGKTRNTPSLIPKGSRHNTLFEWTNGDNFTLEEIKALFYLTCDNLEDKLKFENYQKLLLKNTIRLGSSPNTHRRGYWHYFLPYKFEGDFPAKFARGFTLPPAFQHLLESYTDSSIQQQQEEAYEEALTNNDLNLSDMFETNNIIDHEEPFSEPQLPLVDSEKIDPVKPIKKDRSSQTPIRLRPEDPPVAMNYADLKQSRLIPNSSHSTVLSELGFNPDRVRNAIIDYQTPPEVILFAAGVENRFNLFLEDTAWLGRHLEYVVLNFLKDQNLLKIIFLSEENKNQWFLFDGRSWVPSSSKQIMDQLYRILLELNLGGLEREINEGQALKALSVLTEHESWPKISRGLTFRNGTLIIDNEERPLVIPHNDRDYIKQKWMVDYDINAWLTPADCKLLQDVCAGKTRLYHILRLMIFLVFVQGHHQLGFFLYGPPGGSKTTLMNYLKGLDVKNQSTIDPRTISINKFHIGDLIANKSLLLVPDAGPGSLGKAIADILKVLLGRDSLVGEKKFEEAWNFVSDALLVIVSNFAPAEIPVFRDPAILQRIINVPTPAIQNDFRVSQLEKLLLNNPSGMINWGLNISKDFVSENIRATSINEAINSQNDSIDQFIQSCIFKKSNNFVSNLDLTKTYAQFSENLNSNRTKSPKSEDLKEGSDDIKTEMTEFAGLLSNESQKRAFLSKFKTRLTSFKGHRIKESRKGKIRERGFENLELNLNNKDLNSESKMEKETRLAAFLDESPFAYYGVILPDPQTGRLVQSQPPDPSIQSNSEKTAYVVYRFPFKVLLNLKTPFYYINSHLTTNQETAGLNLEETLKWDLSSKQTWMSKVDPSQRLSQASLNSFEITQLSIPEEATKQDSQVEKEFEESEEDLQVLESLDSQEDLRISPIIGEDIDTDGTENSDSVIEPEEDLSDEDLNVEPEYKNLNTSELQETNPKTTKPRGRKAISKPKTTRSRPRSGSKTKSTSSENEEGEEGDKQTKSILSLDLPKGWEQMEEIQLFNFCFEKALNHLSKDLLKDFKNAFYLAKLKFKENSKVMRSCLERDSFEGYFTFQEEYSSAPLIMEALEQFRFFPQLILFEFLILLNNHFRPLLINAFNQVRNCKNPSPYSFFGRSLPGSVDLIKPKSLFFELNQNKFSPEKLAEMESKFDGGSLFPLGYDLGDKSYGRLLSVPRSTCSTMKHEIKAIALENMSKKSGLNFIELDLKSCHTVIYKTLAQRAGYGLDAEIPNPIDLWPILTKAFLEARENVDFSSQSFSDIVLNWRENQIKTVLKAQWYKGLNAGNVFKSFDILNNARNSLQIPNKDQVLSNPNLDRGLDNDFDIKGLAMNVEKINRKIVYFADLYKFNDAINANSEIYLPTQIERFLTTTLSKKQEEGIRRKKFDSSQKNQYDQGLTIGKTGMSRIFSTCEVVLVMMVFLALEKFPNIMPLAYEADGLLLTGYVQDPSLLLKEINLEFSKLSKRFIEGDYVLEFKKIYGQEGF